MCVPLCPGPRVPFSSEKGCWRWWWKASVFILVILSTWNMNMVTFWSPDLWLFIPPLLRSPLLFNGYGQESCWLAPIPRFVGKWDHESCFRVLRERDGGLEWYLFQCQPRVASCAIIGVSVDIHCFLPIRSTQPTSGRLKNGQETEGNIKDSSTQPSFGMTNGMDSSFPRNFHNNSKHGFISKQY